MVLADGWSLLFVIVAFGPWFMAFVALGYVGAAVKAWRIVDLDRRETTELYLLIRQYQTHLGTTSLVDKAVLPGELMVASTAIREKYVDLRNDVYKSTYRRWRGSRVKITS